MSSENGTPDRIVGRRPAVSRRDRLILTVIAVPYLGFLAWTWSRGSWSSSAVFLTVVTASGVMRLRRPTVVDAGGITRRWRLRSSLRWDEIELVTGAQPGVERVRLSMKDGRTVTLDDVHVDLSAAVAAMGGVPFARPARPAPTTHHTHRDPAADIERRVRAVADRGKLLDAEYRRIRRGRPTDGP
ncbi:hypothetical protein [Nakamurella deserti]|uniref:hypothetical protein n=1 Tax=Nakamurella deserti TaxID=2164074 RepID=UPI00130097D5|nr:hypothetical protein [Nakamurella deserti]